MNFRPSACGSCLGRLKRQEFNLGMKTIHWNKTNKKGTTSKLFFLLYFFNATNLLHPGDPVSLRLLNLQRSFIHAFTILSYGISGFNLLHAFEYFCLFVYFLSDYEMISWNKSSKPSLGTSSAVPLEITVLLKCDLQRLFLIRLISCFCKGKHILVLQSVSAMTESFWGLHSVCKLYIWSWKISSIFLW